MLHQFNFEIHTFTSPAGTIDTEALDIGDGEAAGLVTLAPNEGKLRPVTLLLG